MKTHLYFLGVLIFLNCSVRQDLRENVESTTTVDKTTIADHIKPEILNLDLVLYKNGVLHNFSSPVEKDSFEIYVTGKSILEGEINFRIISYSGKILLEQKFPANYLIGYGLVDTVDPTEKEKEDFIKRRIDDFFDEENFKEPAISKEEIFDEDYSIEETWEDIKSDETAIGFSYLVGEESSELIAYSKTKGIVVSYFWCC